MQPVERPTVSLAPDSSASWRAYFALTRPPVRVRDAATAAEATALRAACLPPLAPLGIDTISGGLVCYAPGPKSDSDAAWLCRDIALSLLRNEPERIVCGFAAGRP